MALQFTSIQIHTQSSHIDDTLGNLPTWVPQPYLPCAESSISLQNVPSGLDSTPCLTDLYIPNLFYTALLCCGRPTLLQGIFPTQGSNPGLQLFRCALYHMNHEGNPTYTPHLHFSHVSALPSRLDVTSRYHTHTHHISPRMPGVSYWETTLACDLSHIVPMCATQRRSVLADRFI